MSQPSSPVRSTRAIGHTPGCATRVRTGLGDHPSPVLAVGVARVRVHLSIACTSGRVLKHRPWNADAGAAAAAEGQEGPDHRPSDRMGTGKSNSSTTRRFSRARIWSTSPPRARHRRPNEPPCRQRHRKQPRARRGLLTATGADSPRQATRSTTIRSPHHEVTPCSASADEGPGLAVGVLGRRLPFQERAEQLLVAAGEVGNESH